MVKMYQHIKNEVSMSTASKDRHRQTRRHTDMMKSYFISGTPFYPFVNVASLADFDQMKVTISILIYLQGWAICWGKLKVACIWANVMKVFAVFSVCNTCFVPGYLYCLYVGETTARIYIT